MNQGLSRLGPTPSVHGAPIGAFGIAVAGEMMVIPGRELPPPKLSYRSGKPPNVRDGTWNILDVNFQRGSIVNSYWVLIVTDGPLSYNSKSDIITNLYMRFGAKLTKSGVTVRSPPTVLETPKLEPEFRDPSRRKALNTIRQTIQKHLTGIKPSFIVVLLSRQDNHIYPGIKRMCDVELGLHTVHMLTTNALNERKQDQYLSNVVLKVNTKLGGINHSLDKESMQWLTTKRTMVVGMDVTHPGPGSVKWTPSP